jgi:hypothetical protein
VSLQRSYPARPEETVNVADPADPSRTVTQFCQLENISKAAFYALPLEERPDHYYNGNSMRIPDSARFKWRAQRMARAAEIAARASDHAVALAAKRQKD